MTTKPLRRPRPPRCSRRCWKTGPCRRRSPSVTTTDTGAGVGLVGDLRYCIDQANAMAGADVITFAIPGRREWCRRSTLVSSLPSIKYG